MTSAFISIDNKSVEGEPLHTFPDGMPSPGDVLEIDGVAHSVKGVRWRNVTGGDGLPKVKALVIHVTKHSATGWPLHWSGGE
jgi:hypothetical protein